MSGTCQCSQILPELWQCRRTPTWLYQGCCAHVHSSSQKKTSQCLLQPKTWHRKNVALQDCLCTMCLLCMFVKNSFFYLDKVFGPSCPQDTTTAISQSVPSIFCYFTTVGIGTSIDDQLKCQRIHLIKNVPNQSHKGWRPLDLQLV